MAGFCEHDVYVMIYGTIVNDDSTGMGEETVVAYFKALSHRIYGI